MLTMSYHFLLQRYEKYLNYANIFATFYQVFFKELYGVNSLYFVTFSVRLQRITVLLVVMTMSVQTASADVEINKTNFPDDIFRNMSFTMRTIRM